MLAIVLLFSSFLNEVLKHQLFWQKRGILILFSN